jgi:ATP-dependent RNA helicase DeaD
MLCKAGGLTKRQLGAIRIQQNETHVEIDADSIDAFFDHLGEGARLEKSIYVKRLGSAAPATQQDRSRPAPRPHRPHKPTHPDRPDRPNRERPAKAGADQRRSGPNNNGPKKTGLKKKKNPRPTAD